ncbi:MAG: hypothetical protein HY435_02530 [Candidatus Liptonbacteria bacterium]|nr:hypothetical protein [Candidatus Liptonbacteria bacterium]
MTRLAYLLVFLIIAVLLWTQVYTSFSNERSAAREFEETSAKLERARAEIGELQSEFEYLLEPGNLEEELKARLNYRRVGEEMIIIVPRAETSSDNEAPR